MLCGQVVKIARITKLGTETILMQKPLCGGAAQEYKQDNLMHLLNIYELLYAATLRTARLAVR